MKVKNLDGFKKEPVISVIVPVYNSESYLKDCLDSIIEQTYKNLEIILIDDGSIDDSLSIIQMYAKNDSRIMYDSIKNSGPGFARNKGLDKFTGDFVFFVDADDVLCRDLFELLIKNVSSPSDVAMCKFSKDMKYFGNGDKQIVCQSGSFTDNMKQMYSPGCSSSGPCAKLYGRAIFSTLRFPNIAMYEDAAISLQVLSLAKNVTFFDYIGYYYRFNPESITNTKVSERNFCIFKKTEIVLDFIKKEHPEATKLVHTICLNDNEYVMMESTRTKTDLSKKLFNALFIQNKELVKNLGLRKMLYLNKTALYLLLKMMSKVYYNDYLRMTFKKILGV